MDNEKPKPIQVTIGNTHEPKIWEFEARTLEQIGVSTCASIKDLKLPKNTEENYHFLTHVSYAIKAFKKLGIKEVNNITDERIRI